MSLPEEPGFSPPVYIPTAFQPRRKPVNISVITSWFDSYLGPAPLADRPPPSIFVPLREGFRYLDLYFVSHSEIEWFRRLCGAEPAEDTPESPARFVARLSRRHIDKIARELRLCLHHKLAEPRQGIVTWRPQIVALATFFPAIAAVNLTDGTSDHRHFFGDRQTLAVKALRRSLRLAHLLGARVVEMVGGAGVPPVVLGKAPPFDGSSDRYFAGHCASLAHAILEAYIPSKDKGSYSVKEFDPDHPDKEIEIDFFEGIRLEDLPPVALELEPGASFLLNELAAFRAVQKAYDDAVEKRPGLSDRQRTVLHHKLKLNLDLAHAFMLGIKPADLHGLPVGHVHASDHAADVRRGGSHASDLVPGKFHTCEEYKKWLDLIVNHCASEADVSEDGPAKEGEDEEDKYTPPSFSNFISIELEACNQVESLHSAMSTLRRWLSLVEVPEGRSSGLWMGHDHAEKVRGFILNVDLGNSSAVYMSQRQGALKLGHAVDKLMTGAYRGGGHILSFTGDGFIAFFETQQFIEEYVKQEAERILEDVLQEAWESWGPEEGMNLRMALHYGDGEILSSGGLRNQWMSPDIVTSVRLCEETKRLVTRPRAGEKETALAVTGAVFDLLPGPLQACFAHEPIRAHFRDGHSDPHAIYYYRPMTSALRGEHTSLAEAARRIAKVRRKELPRLDLSSLKLHGLREMAAMPFVRELDLRGNELAQMPFAQSKLPSLDTLLLDGNHLSKLPDSMRQMSRLDTLTVSQNRIGVLPDWMGELSSLRMLDLCGNPLKELPPSVQRLKKLETLRLGSTGLAALPEWVGELAALKSLHLDCNGLDELPSSLRRLKNLECIYLHGNPALGLPDEVLGPPWEQVRDMSAVPKAAREILDYYFSIRDGKGVPLRELKLVVVGHGRRGKTTLIRRLSGKPMRPDEPETHGITRQPLSLPCTDGMIQAMVWDFGGQAVLHSMHEFFFTARSLYLLVLDQTVDRHEAEAAYWLQLIRSYAPEAPVVIALNKSRGIERPIDKESLKKDFDPIVSWVATECLPDSECSGAEATIAGLKQLLTDAAEEKRMPEPRKLLPKKWLDIKSWLEGLHTSGKNYLSYTDFEEGCAERGETDAQRQEEVAATMHELGIAMNYARYESLLDTTVLHPDWLANGIYAVLRANIMIPDKRLVPDAVLTVPKLMEIFAAAGQPRVGVLNPADYPQQQCEFLLYLMGAFQLTFPLREDRSQQLCPTLLDVRPPPGCDEPAGPETSRLRYEFALLPPPLLPRLIVRTFSLIATGKLWQRGVMLEQGSATARVWTTPEEKYLFATVGGPIAHRRELVDIIRTALKELFSKYSKLEVHPQMWYAEDWNSIATLEKLGVLKADWCIAENPQEGKA